MKLSVFTLLFGLASLAMAQNKTVLLAGDSWSWLMCANHSMGQALKEAQISAELIACTGSTSPGIRAERWHKENVRKGIASILENREVDVMYFSLGGNDFLSKWKKGMSLDQEMQISREIRDNVLRIVKSFLKYQPNMKILVSGYDFGRFESNHGDIPHYKKKYKKAGKPSTAEMHAAFVRFTEVMASMADNQIIFFIHHLGLMHYYFGNREVGLRPGQTLAPHLISPPNSQFMAGGNYLLEQDPRAMIRLGKIIDAYHLSPRGFFYVARHSVQHYLADWLR